MTFRQFEITPESFATDALTEFVGPGDLLLNLAWNIDAGVIIGWCQAHGVMYLDTSVEEWDPYREVERPQERTLYHRHMALREQAASWPANGPTAVVEHGANPGLVSHWAKRALVDIATEILGGAAGEHRRRSPRPAHRRARRPRLRGAGDGDRHEGDPHLRARHPDQLRPEAGRASSSTRGRSTASTRRASRRPSWAGAPTRTGCRSTAFTHTGGPENQIGIAKPGIDTLVRSWVPIGGPIIGMVVRHGEAFTISDAPDGGQDGEAVYRPTVHYAYLPTDVAMASLHECRMSGYELQDAKRIMTDDITEGMDELGVLLLGHDLNGWWVGSQLDIDEARELVPHQNATTLQVAASILGAVFWMIEHPDRGLCVPDDLDHEAVLAVADPYLGPCPSVQTDWRPSPADLDPLADVPHRRAESRPPRGPFADRCLAR